MIRDATVHNCRHINLHKTFTITNIQILQGENKKLQDQLNSDIEMMKVQQENEQLREMNEKLKSDYDKARKVNP